MSKLTGTMAAALFEFVNGQESTAKSNTVKALVSRGLVVDGQVTDAGREEYVAVYGPLPVTSEEEDPIVSVMMNRKDRRDAGRDARVESRRLARVRDQRTKKWGGNVIVKAVTG
jgi:hypothetical protein